MLINKIINLLEKAEQRGINLIENRCPHYLFPVFVKCAICNGEIGRYQQCKGYESIEKEINKL